MHASPWDALRVAVLALSLACCGCRSGAAPPAPVAISLEVAPSPPRVGVARVTLRLADSAGAPIVGARLTLEGTMNHAGMKPEFAALADAGGGSYTGTLAFTMAGDWFLLVTGELPDGGRVDHRIPVNGVSPK